MSQLERLQVNLARAAYEVDKAAKRAGQAAKRDEWLSGRVLALSREVHQLTRERDALLKVCEAEETWTRHADDCCVCQDGCTCQTGIELAATARQLLFDALQVVRCQPDSEAGATAEGS